MYEWRQRRSRDLPQTAKFHKRFASRGLREIGSANTHIVKKVKSRIKGVVGGVRDKGEGWLGKVKPQ